MRALQRADGDEEDAIDTARETSVRLEPGDIEPSATIGAVERRSVTRAVPSSVWAVAMLTALLSLTPYWRAQSQTPAGWTFTGNVIYSPDVIQYRAWFRQTQNDGVLLTDKFTSEAHRPFLVAVPYYAVGKIARWTGTSPESINAYAGAALVVLLVVLLFVTVREFLAAPHPTWIVLLAILFGGGLGGHLLLLNHFSFVRHSPFLKSLMIDSLAGQATFEQYRGHYVFVTLFDTHFLLVWVLTTATVLSLFLTLRRFSVLRLGSTIVLGAATTLLHVYEGVTLLAIIAGVALSYRYKGLLRRQARVTLGACALVIVFGLVWLALLQRASGLPLPSWRGLNVPFSMLLLSYALAWLLIAWGIGRYWRRAGSKECFLLGWALGCTALTLSGPFYPYPARGTMTLQIPLFIIAGSIYFSRRPRLTWRAALVALVLLGATPAYTLGRFWKHTRFEPRATHMFLGPAHREILDLLNRRAGAADVLLAEEGDTSWLAPEYPGTHYCAHFFLTVDYDRKRSEVARFFEASATRQAAFLRREGIRFLYVDAAKEPARFEGVPGLTLLKATSIGSLFEYVDPTGSASG